MRSPLVAVLAGLALAAFGAVILGEYELVGYRPIVAGAIFGAAVAEAMATVHRAADRHLMAASALATEAGLLWATWISTSHHLDLAAGTAWAGVVAGVVVAPMWLRSAGRRGAHTPAGTAPSPGG